MPRLKKTEAQRRAERFSEHYHASKANFKLTEPQIAAALGICVTALRKYRRDPDKAPFGIVLRMGETLEWSDEVYQDIIRAQK